MIKYRTRELCIVERDACADWCYDNNIKFEEIRVSDPVGFWLMFIIEDIELLSYAKLKWDLRTIYLCTERTQKHE